MPSASSGLALIPRSRALGKESHGGMPVMMATYLAFIAVCEVSQFIAVTTRWARSHMSVYAKLEAHDARSQATYFGCPMSVQDCDAPHSKP